MKRGISPLIGSVLLIAFVIILFISITVWVRQSAINPAMQETEEKVASDLESLNTKIGVSNVKIIGNKVKLTITNLGSTEIKSFSVRVIGSSGVDVVPVDKSLDELETITEEVDFNLGKTGTVEKIEIIPVVSSGLAIGATSFKEISSGAIIDTSCLVIHQKDSDLETGVYAIDTDGEGGNEPFDVYCDMESDGGGYTMYKVHVDSEYNAQQAEDYCANLGIQLFIPRSEAHLKEAYYFMKNIGTDRSDLYLRILGIYPKSQGASCVNIPFTDEDCTTWHASDDKGFWISTRTDITEPNSDNGVGCSMYYSWKTDGNINWYNDILCPGYTSERFICDVGDKYV